MSDRVTRKPAKVPAFLLERCKRCGICTHLCPTGAIAPNGQGVPSLVDPGACTSCRLCEHICPDFAVTMVLPEEVGRRPGGETTQDRSDDHPSTAPEVCHPFADCDG